MLKISRVLSFLSKARTTSCLYLSCTNSETARKFAGGVSIGRSQPGARRKPFLPARSMFSIAFSLQSSSSPINITVVNFRFPPKLISFFNAISLTKSSGIFSSIETLSGLQLHIDSIFC